MQTWAEYELFSRPGWRLWNTSVCKGPDGYRMAIEVSLDENMDEERKKALQPVIGVPFTEFFLIAIQQNSHTPLDKCAII